MRTGQNPAKSIDHLIKPQRVTVAVITYIPFLSGYYAQSLEVLKVSLNSIWANSDLPFDLMVFDNASCPEVQEYLLENHQNGNIQFLTLSQKNIGKGGAWNFLFSSAPGEYIAYSDGDIYHNPGWLSAMVNTLETFPNAGMLTGIPMWSPEEFSTSTLLWAEGDPEVTLEHGKLLTWEDYWKHASSLGHSEQKARGHFETCEESMLEYRGVKCYIGAGHFQFLAPRKALQTILPIAFDRPMGQVRRLDIALNDNGFLRLSTQTWWVQHLGNTLSREFSDDSDDRNWTRPTNAQAPAGSASGIWRWKPLRRFLQWSHGKTFEILYRN
jgi:glycosyltransferase involved in cell wall biosynthesis